MEGKFSKGVSKWQGKLGLVRDAVRQELVTRQLREHLPPPASIRILDVGSGQGTQANRLADLGYSVVGIEPSEELLEIAVRASRKSKNSAKFLKGTLEDIPDEAGGDFDLVCCHGVLMYLPDLKLSIKKLVSLARTGGLLSVLTRNQAGIAMRAGMREDWPAAIKGFDEQYYKNSVGINNVRADKPDEVIAAFQVNNAELVAWYGVRLFTDHWKDRPVPDNFEQLVEAEFQAGSREPYKQLTALTHVIARRA